MAEQHGLFDSPKKLIVVIVLAFLIPITLAVMVAQLATSGRRGTAGSEEAVLRRIQPVARVEVAGPPAGGQAGAQTPEEIYKATCAACHDAGVAGAPKTGDKAAWAPRIAMGLEKLTESAIKGKGAMPPRGGAANVSDGDLARVIAFMANKSGASFEVPAAEMAAKPTAPAAEAAAAPPEPQTQAAAPAQEAPPTPQAAAPAAASAAPAGDAGADKGKSVYDVNCAACHNTGAAGAPKLGDKPAWAARLATGVDALVGSAIKGKGVMPPKGGNVSLSDTDVKAAVEFMVSQAK